MLTDKGYCKHGEFILTEGCPQCIAEKWQRQEPAPVNTHQPYRLADGSIVPGVTTVLGVLDKGEGLTYWAWDLGRQGLDYREVRDAAGRVGTLTHDMIACRLAGRGIGVSGYSPEEIKKAERCFKKYLAWEKENPLTAVMIEERLVSEGFKYGGTPDLLAEINGEFVLIDFKTGSRIYESYFHQVAAYRMLLEEQGWPVAQVWILRLSPDDSEYEMKMQLNSNRDWQIFQHALAIWRLRGWN